MRSALSDAMVRPPHPEDVNLDLLADALFPLIEINEDAHVDDDPDTLEPLPPPVLEREPRSQLLRRVKDGLEPEIDSCVLTPCFTHVLGWHSLICGMLAVTPV